MFEACGSDISKNDMERLLVRAWKTKKCMEKRPEAEHFANSEHDESRCVRLLRSRNFDAGKSIRHMYEASGENGSMNSRTTNGLADPLRPQTRFFQVH